MALPSLEGIKNAIPLNWDLLRNPVNWIIVFLMVAIAGAAIAIIFSATGASNEDNNA